MYIAIEPTETDFGEERAGGKVKGLLGYDILGPNQQLEIPVVQTELPYPSIGRTIEEDWVLLGGGSTTYPASTAARNNTKTNIM